VLSTYPPWWNTTIKAAVGRLPLPILRDVRSRIIVVILPAKRIRNEEEEQNTDVVTLPNELWMRGIYF
jgi:hypothetical protein